MRSCHSALETKTEDRDLSKMNSNALESRDLGFKITTLFIGNIMQDWSNWDSQCLVSERLIGANSGRTCCNQVIRNNVYFSVALLVVFS